MQALVAKWKICLYAMDMETIFDWLTVALFAAIAVLFLQRSFRDDEVDSIWHYLPPCIVLAIANQLGNHGYTTIAAIMIVAALAYFVKLLIPMGKSE